PENAWGHYMLGLSAWKSHDFESADAAFRRALELDPKHVKSMLNLSRVLLDSGKAEGALEQLYAVFEVDPDSGTAYRLQGRALHQLGDTTDAIQAYLDAILIDPSDAWAINNLGLIYIEQGRFEDALPALARAVELRDDVAIFHNNLGMALERTGRYRAAEEQYRAAVDRNVTHDVAASNLARITDVKEEPDTPSFDLTALAEAFVASCRPPVSSVSDESAGDSEMTAAATTAPPIQEVSKGPIKN
ncbi:MAG: tetratricopeptide repeat protein, partial [Rhodothermales bacterium]|nr:tetratricopeptide repeat protein [Rhodothermales bacterium]